jgi:hypothetical protein
MTDHPAAAGDSPGTAAPLGLDHAGAASTGAGLASEVFLFLHAGGVPIDGIARQLEALGCFGQPDAWFDLDGRMWTRMRSLGADSLAGYLESLITRTDHGGGILSAVVDYQDLLWLEQRPMVRDQLRQRLRVVRLAFLDPALQAYRRWRAARTASCPAPNDHAAPGFADLSRELIGIEEAEQLGDVFCQRHGLPMVKLWVEDLARPGAPALRGLLARWSLPPPDDASFLPIDPPARAEQEITAAFRAEAARRHWSHALLPRVIRRPRVMR